MTTIRIARFVAITGLCFAARAQAVNLVPNGDFSMGNAEVGSDYAFSAMEPCGNTTEGQYTIGMDPAAWNCTDLTVSVGDHTTGSGDMLIANGGSTELRVWFTTAPIPVTPQTTYFFEAWILNWSTTSVGVNAANLTFRANGVNLATASAADVGVWTPVSTTWNSGTETSVSLSLFNSTPTELGNDFAVDDVYFGVTSSIGCVSPIEGCRTAAKSQLRIKNDASNDKKDQLAWAWSKGQATTLEELGNPVTQSTYRMCLYSGPDAATLAQVVVPPDATRWRPLPKQKGYKYKDKAATRSGVKSILLKVGSANKAKAVFVGKGVELPDPLLGDLPLPVTVQLVDDETGVCFEARYDSGDVKKNDATEFKAKVK